MYNLNMQDLINEPQENEMQQNHVYLKHFWEYSDIIPLLHLNFTFFLKLIKCICIPMELKTNLFVVSVGVESK